MSTMTGNPTYNLTAMSKDEILQNHYSEMLTFGISLPEEDIDLPKLYWIPELHKNPHKQKYIAGSAVLNQIEGKVQLSHTSHQRHQRERNTNTK